VKAVNKKFGTFVFKGYETDRGRIYLQYGPPDKREEYPSEPNAYPYEIWVYYRLSDNSNLNPTQTNKQFIFYNQDLVTNNYQLLHSNALSETHDSRWEMKLHKRTVQSNDFEKKDAPGHFGGNASDEFSNPK
ncbi:MAG: GWxTD domain-containing protein, partial [Bacteroidota bacterium]